MQAARNPLTLAAVVSLWLTAVCNWPLWRALAELPELQSQRGLLLIPSFALSIAAFSMAFLTLGAWPRSIKSLSTLLLGVAAIGAHFIGSYHVVINPTMMINVLHINAHSAADLVGWNLLLSISWMAGLPAWWLWRTPIASMPAASQALHNAAALTLSLCLVMSLLVLNLATMASIMHNHKSLRYMINPANSFYALGRLALQR